MINKRLLIASLISIFILSASQGFSTTVYSNNFEAKSGKPKVANVSGNSFWQWGQPIYYPTYAASGTNCWGTGLDAPYLPFSSTYLTFTNINLVGSSYANLSFQFFENLDYYYSGADLQIALSSATNLYVTIGSVTDNFYDTYSISALSGGTGWAYSSGSWVQKQIDLSAFAGNKVNLRFRFGSGSLNSYNYTGLFIDDLVVQNTPVSVAGLGYAYNNGSSQSFVDTTNTYSFVFYTSKKMIKGSKVIMDIPLGWTAPQVANRNQLGYVAVSNFYGTARFNPIPQIIGNQLIITITNMAPYYDEIKIVYGDGKGAVPSNIPGQYTFTFQTANPVEMPLDILYPPQINILDIKPVPYFEDFEGTAAGWNEQGTLHEWQRGHPSGIGPGAAHSGQNCYKVNLNGPYADIYSYEPLFSPPINLKSTSNAYLQFYQYYDIFHNSVANGNDGAAVYVSTNGGNWFDKLGVYPVDYNNDGLTGWWVDAGPFWDGNSGGWVKVRMDLKPYVGKIIILRFLFGTYGNEVGGNYGGWAIDDVSVLTNPFPISGTGTCSITNTAAPAGVKESFLLKYVAGANVINGKFQVRIPSGWTPPQVGIPTSPGYISIMPDMFASVSVAPVIAGNLVTVDIVNMPEASSFTIGYSNAMTRTLPGISVFTAKSAGPSSGLSNLSVLPSVQLIPRITSFPYLQDFENDNGGFTPSPSYKNIWDWGVPVNVGPPKAYSGQKCWGTSIGSNFNTNTSGTPKNYHLLSPYFDLSSITNAYLEFAYYMDTAPFDQDGGVILISTNNSPFSYIGTYPQVYNNQYLYYDNVNFVWVPGLGGNSGGWQLAQFDLTPYSGKQLQLDFQFVNSYSYYPGHAGFYIDHVVIKKAEIPVAGTGAVILSPNKGMILPSITTNLSFDYLAQKQFYNGSVTFQIPAGFSTPQSGNPLNPGYVNVVVISNAVINPSLSISGSGPWVVRVAVSNMAVNGAFRLFYNNVNPPPLTGGYPVIIQSGLLTETLKNISPTPVIYLMKTISSFPFTADFETNDDYFMPQISKDISWKRGIPQKSTPVGAASGQKCWSTGISNYYTALPGPAYDLNRIVSLYSPVFNLIGVTNSYLQFSYYNDTPVTDPVYSIFFLSKNNSAFTQMGGYPDLYNVQYVYYDPILNYDTSGLNGNSKTWKTARIDLTPYSGQKIQFAFGLYDIESTETNHSGLSIDNLTVGRGFVPAAGSGKVAVSPLAIGPSSVGAYVFIFTADSAFYKGNVSFTIPSTWTQPQIVNSNLNGYIKISSNNSAKINNHVQISGVGPWTVTVQVTNIPISGGFSLLYKNASSPAAQGVYTFGVKTGLNSETPQSIANNPVISVLPIIVPPYNEDFESGNGTFNQIGSVYNLWQMGSPTWGPGAAYSGNRCWGTGLYGNYNNVGCSEDLYSPIVDLTSKSAGSVVFYQWFDLSQYDAGIIVTISTDFINYQQLGYYPQDYNNQYPYWYWDNSTSYYQLNANSGNSGGWVKKAFDLTSYAGKKFLLKFHFGNDQWDYQANAHTGWFLDDFNFFDTPPPLAGTGTCTVYPGSGLIGSTNSYGFNYFPENNMHAGSRVLLYFPVTWKSPVNNVLVYAATGTSNSYSVDTVNGIQYNVLQVTIKSNLAYGNYISINYTNVVNSAASGSYQFLFKSAGPGESPLFIQNSPVVTLQKIQKLPYREDFEKDSGSYVSGSEGLFTSSFGLWQWGKPVFAGGPQFAESGTNCWGTGMNGDYNKGSALEYIESPPINLTAETQAYLTFWQYYDTQLIEGITGDGGFLQIRYGSTVNNLYNYDIAGLSTYNENFIVTWGPGLQPYNSFWGGSSYGWIKTSISLKNYTGNFIKLRFVFGSDDKYSHQKPGWYVDNIRIDNVAPQLPTVPYTLSQIFGQSYTADIHLADLKNSGNLDVVQNNYFQNNNILWNNDGSGHFKQSTSVGKNSAYRSVCADFNNDGYVDIFNANSLESPGSQSPNLPQNGELFINNGDGTFQLKETIGNNITMDADYGDINNDGFVDIVLGNVGANEILLNDGKGNFNESQAILPGHNTFAIKLADVNNDGYLDLILGERAPELSEVLLNDGNGNFVESSNFLGQFNVLCMAVGDITGNGFPDIVIGNDNGISILTNNGHGKFGLLPQNSIQIQDRSALTNNPVESIELADINNDGKLDLIVGNYLAGTRVYINQGHHIFKDSNNDLGSYPTKSLVTGDIEHDGNLDIVQGNFNNSPSVVWRCGLTNRNTRPQPPTSVTAVVKDGVMTVNWNSGSDLETSTNLLTYNLRVGTKPDGNDVLSVPGGQNPRYLGTFGNVGHSHSHVIKNINKISTYYVSVQTVDSGKQASTWRTFILYYDNQPPEANKIKVSDNFLNLGKGDTSIISFNLKNQEQISIYVYNIAGVVVRTFVDKKTYPAGYDYSQNINWDGTNDEQKKLGPGIYWVVIRSSTFVDKQKILLVW